MKTKALICAFLCAMLIPVAAFGTQNEEGSAADDTQQYTQPMPPQQGETVERGFGGRGGMNGHRMPPDMHGGEDMQMPPNQMQENTSSETKEETVPNYFTHVSAAVLLVLGFLFVIFYKRRTF